MRLQRRLLIFAAVAVLVLVAAGWDVRQVVFPSTQRPARTDVIVLLGGAYRPGELPAARRAYRASPDATVLVSDPFGGCPRVAMPQVCFVPEPSTTQGEAEFAARYAKAHHARSITVVAPSYQAARARLWFSRCSSGDIAVVAGSSSLGTRIGQIPHQTGGFLKALLITRGC